MRKEYGAGLVFVLFLISFAQLSADEFKTKGYYDHNNPLVQEIALNLRGDNDLETAENIWNWINQNISYEQCPEQYDVKYTLRTKKGNCANHAYLAASLLLAADWAPDAVRIGEGYRQGESGHAWVEILVNKWHRFDAVYTWTFQEEFSCGIYQEGEDYPRINYYYYDPRAPAKLILESAETELHKDIHLIKLTITNEGEMKRVIKPEIITNLEIIGTSSESIEIDASDTLNFKIYLKGEGHVRIELDEIIFEADLKYPQKENHEQNETKRIETVPQENRETEESLQIKQSTEKVEIKKISLPKSSEAEKIRIINTSTQKESNSLPIFITLITLITIPIFISVRRFIL